MGMKNLNLLILNVKKVMLTFFLLISLGTAYIHAVFPPISSSKTMDTDNKCEATSSTGITSNPAGQMRKHVLQVSTYQVNSIIHI